MEASIKRLEELKMFLVTSQVTRLEAAQLLEPIIKQLKEIYEESIAPPDPERDE